MIISLLYAARKRFSGISLYIPYDILRLFEDFRFDRAWRIYVFMLYVFFTIMNINVEAKLSAIQKINYFQHVCVPNENSV